MILEQKINYIENKSFEYVMINAFLERKEKKTLLYICDYDFY